MCSIIGTKYRTAIMPLYEKSSERGKYSYSVSVYDYKNKNMLFVYRSLGELTEQKLNDILTGVEGDYYYIIHSQAPTTENAAEDSIHPAAHLDTGITYSYLWHNGIIKPKSIKYLQTVTNSESTWDTQLLLQYITQSENLSNIDGSFACLMYHKGEMFMFRNEIAPLFTNFDLTISSVMQGGDISFSVVPNKVYKLNLANDSTEIVSTFVTKNSPYILEL